MLNEDNLDKIGIFYIVVMFIGNFDDISQCVI